MIETAILVPLLTLFIAGIIEWGLAMYNQYRLTSAVREGARVASVSQLLVEDDDKIRDTVINNLALIGVSNTPIISNTTPTVGVSVLNANGEECAAAVSVQANVNFQFYILAALGMRTWNLRAKATMRYGLQPLCS